jgi:hypothetical protein
MTRLAIIATIETPLAPQSKFFRVAAARQSASLFKNSGMRLPAEDATIRVKLVYFGVC